MARPRGGMKRCRICKERKPRREGFALHGRTGKRRRRCRACWNSRPNEAEFRRPGRGWRRRHTLPGGGVVAE